MVDLLGPGDAGSINTLTTTSDVSHPIAGDTWFQDCIGGDASSGTPTPIMAKWLNWLMQQDRAAIRFAGIPVANAYDYMLSWAMQSGFANWIAPSFGGSANALTGAAPNSPQTIPGGTVVCGLISTGSNTGALTFNWSGLGPQPVLTIEGDACIGGEIVNNYFLVMRWDGSAWRIVSPLPWSYTRKKIPDPFTRTDIGAALHAVSFDLFGTSGINLSTMIGAQGTWSYASTRGDSEITPGDGGDYAVVGGNYYGLFSIRDLRWPSSAPTGIWQISEIWIPGTGYGGVSVGGGTNAIFRRIS